MTIRFKTSWNGYEFGTVVTLSGSLETSLIASNIADSWVVNQEQRSDRVAVIRYDNTGTALGVVAQSPTGAEVVIPISTAAAIPTPPAAAKVLVSTGSTAGAFNWADPTGGTGASAPTAVTHSDAIPLDTTGFGKVSNAIVAMTAARTLTAAAGSVVGGSYDVTFEADGNSAHGVTIPGAWVQTNSNTFNSANNQLNRYVFEYAQGGIVTYGILNLGVQPDPVAGQPTGLALSGAAGANTAALVWTAPTIDATHGTPLDYIVETNAAGAGWVVFADGVTPSTGASLTGLPANTAMQARVSASNGSGAGPTSAVVAFTTAASTAFSITWAADADTPFGTTALGHGLAAALPSTNTAWRILTGRAVGNQTVSGQAFQKLTYSANGEISLADGLGGLGGMRFGVLFRYVDDNNFWKCFFAAGNAYLSKIVAGVETYIQAGCSPTTSFGVSFSGSTIAVKANGVVVAALNTTDSGNAAGTGVGFATDSNASFSGFSGT